MKIVILAIFILIIILVAYMYSKIKNRAKEQNKERLDPNEIKEEILYQFKELEKSRISIGTFLIFVGLVICFVFEPSVTAKISGKTKVYETVRDIKIGEKISNNMFKEVEIGSYGLSNQIIDKKTDIENKYAIVYIPRGQYIYKGNVSEKIPYDNEYLYKSITGLNRAISFTIKSLAYGVSNKIISGDIISIIVIDKNSQSNQNQIKEKTYIPDELKYVEVLTTTNETGTDIENIDKKESDKIYQTITVLVNAEQAKLIADAETNKQIYVSLVYRQGNKEVANYLLKRQSDMLAIKYPKSEDDYQTEEDIKSILLDKNEDENKSDTDNNTSLKEINEVLKRQFVGNENEEYLDDELNYDNENNEETEETETSSMIKDTTQVEKKETRNIEQEEYERIKKEYGVN